MMKKVSYDNCITFKCKASELEGPDGGNRHNHGLGHTGHFVVSGSKVLEDIGSYVVVAVGTKSCNGWIMMGLCFSVFSFTGQFFH